MAERFWLRDCSDEQLEHMRVKLALIAKLQGRYNESGSATEAHRWALELADAYFDLANAHTVAGSNVSSYTLVSHTPPA